MKLIGPADFAHFDEVQLRLVTVLFGLGLILLLPLERMGLAAARPFAPEFLTAVSPAMVFYSRYFIHEILLVFFTLLALAASWRYTQNSKLGWALLTGAAVGFDAGHQGNFRADARRRSRGVVFECRLESQKGINLPRRCPAISNTSPPPWQCGSRPF